MRVKGGCLFFIKEGQKMISPGSGGEGQGGRMWRGKMPEAGEKGMEQDDSREASSLQNGVREAGWARGAVREAAQISVD